MDDLQVGRLGLPWKVAISGLRSGLPPGLPLDLLQGLPLWDSVIRLS